MSQKHSSDTKFKIRLTHDLISFRNEIDYVLSVLNKWLNIDFALIDDKKSYDLEILYGNNFTERSNSVIIHEEFFSKYVINNDDGLTIDKSSLKKIIKHAQNVKYSQEDIFVLFLKKDCELLEYNQIKNSYKIKLGIEKRASVDEAFCLFKDVIGHYVKLPSTPKMKVHLTHDVDRLRNYHGYYSLFREKIGQVIKRKLSISSYCSDIYHKLSSKEPRKSFELLMDLSEAYDVKSTFLFLPYSKHPNDATYTVRFKKDFLDMVSSIKKRGHNIGLHPGWGSYNNHDEFLRQKSFLESLISQKVNVCRQHILRWNPRTWKIQSDCGIKTDYTLAYPDGIAFRSQTTKSYPAYDLANRIALPLNVMPTSIMEFALFLDKYKKIPKNKVYYDIENCVYLHKKYGGDLVILFHTVTVMELINEYKKTLDIVFNYK